MSETVEVVVELSEDEKRLVGKLAEAEGVSMNAWIVRAVKTYLKELGVHVGR